MMNGFTPADGGAGPAFAVPPDEGLVRRPRRSVWSRRCAVIEHPAIHRPSPGPADGVAGSVGVRVVATRHHVAFLGPRARVDPAATGSAAIGAQFAEVLQLLTLATNYLAVFIGQVLQRPTVVLHRQLGGGGEVGPLVVPAQVEDRIREGAALILIQLLDPQHELAKN